jgi:hypothetical protein
METFVTLLVPQGSPFLAAVELMDLSSASAIGIRLVAVCTVVTEAAIVGAVLPADWADTIKATLAVIKAKSTILFFAIWASRERFSRCAARDLLPA